MSEIYITTIASATNVKFVVSVPSSPAHTYSQKVYKYLQINHDALPDSKISNVKLKFKIEKSWLNNNGYANADIVLLRYADSKWNPLTTTVTNDDGTYVYYLADSPGLSLFAISTNVPITTPAGNTTLNTTANTTITATTNLTANGTVGNNNTTGTGKVLTNSYWLIPTIVLIVLIVILVLVVRSKNKKEHKERHQ